MKPWQITKAVDVIDHAGIIACPTEAVFGLSCSVFHRQAVEKILRIKYRKQQKGFILVGHDIGQFKQWIDLELVTNSVHIMDTWPGPVTWIIPCNPTTPRWLTGGHKGLAIRISAHPLVYELSKRAGILVSTSANPAGKRPARNGLEVRNYFGNSIDYIFPGQTDLSVNPTEIRDALSGKVLRSA